MRDTQKGPAPYCAADGRYQQMDEEKSSQEEVFRFILTEIETVPHLEALLLLWESRPKRWVVADLSARLFVSPNVVQDIVQDLQRRRLIASEAKNEYFYDAQSEARNQLIESVASTYRRDLIRVSNLIHSKAPRAVRDFANAFKFRKERE